jgi:hypothetical protein
MPYTLTSTQLQALRAFASANGRSWKQELRSQWMAASAIPVLHALRNTHGPSWLAGFRLNAHHETVDPTPAPAAKPVTPQVPAVPGMTPLGLPEEECDHLLANCNRMAAKVAADRFAGFTPVSCTIRTAVPYCPIAHRRSTLAVAIAKAVDASSVDIIRDDGFTAHADITIPQTFSDSENLGALRRIIDDAIAGWQQQDVRL